MACMLGCSCKKHNAKYGLRQRIEAQRKNKDAEPTPKQKFIREQNRRYRAASRQREHSSRGGDDHLNRPSETFDMERALLGLRRILSEVYGADDGADDE